jgi:pyrroloquinoline quinone biosynthesis protein B
VTGGSEAILLGTAQDGGVPKAGCYCSRCTNARANPAQRRWVSCLGLVDHDARQSWLIDATPDLRDQVHALHELVPDCPLSGFALTHAHMGHYAGLVHLGLEAWNARDLPVYASARMAEFLSKNAPWSQLVRLNNIKLCMLEPGLEVQLGPNLVLAPFEVPHRGEFSDTIAFVLRGSARSLFYCPDVDSWDAWDRDLRGFVAACDVALLDGTFYSSGELPGRDMSQIPHHLAVDTAERLAGVDCDVRLIHLNHSNPLHEPGPERAWLAARGIGVGMLADRWRLD